MTSTAKEGMPMASNNNNDIRKKQKRTIVDGDSSSSSTAVTVVPALSLRNILLYFPDLLVLVLPYVAGRTIFNSIASSNKDIYKKSKSILPPWPMDYKLLSRRFSPLWSPCGARIACLCNNNNTIVVHDQRYGPFRNNGNNNHIGLYNNDLKFSPDGSFLVSTSNNCIVTLWDNNIGNYEQLQRWNIKEEITGGRNDFCLIDVSPCSKYIIVAPSLTNRVFLKDAENRGKTIKSLTPHPVMESITEIKFSIDGRAVFVCGKKFDTDAVIMRWRPYLDNADEDSLITLWAPTNPSFVDYMHALSRDSTMIAIHDMMNHNGWLLSMGNDYNCLTDDLNFPAGARELHVLLHFTPDKKFIVYRTNNGLKNWHIAENKWMDTKYYLYNGKKLNNTVVSCSPNYRQFIVHDNDGTYRMVSICILNQILKQRTNGIFYE